MGNLWFVLALGCNVNWLTLPTINFLQWGPGCSKWSAINCVCQLYVGTYSARGQRSLLPYQQFFGNTLIWFINFRNQIKVFQKNCWCGNTVTFDSNTDIIYSWLHFTSNTQGPIAGNLLLVMLANLHCSLWPTQINDMMGGHRYSIWNEINCTCKSQFTSTESDVLAQSLRVYDEYRKWWWRTLVQPDTGP